MIRTAGAALAATALGAALVAAVAWRPAPAEPSDKFAQDKANPPADGGVPGVKTIPFDADRAVGYVKQLCDLGPRISATPAMAKQQELVTKHFEAHGATVTRQEFKARQHSRREQTSFCNLIAAWHPERAKRVILCTHYDTRPAAHEEPNRANWSRPFASANDGTSGVALLMELAHHMKDLPTTYGVDFVLFDAEEYIFEPTGPFGGGDRFFIGSEHFADEYVKTKRTRKSAYEAAVLFDLFAHHGAKLPIEGHSKAMVPALADQIWKVAAAVGAKSFEQRVSENNVRDDHLALNHAGIPAVDVIDFDNYREHWHRLSDTPDKISGPQMAEVAKVMTTWLQLIR